MQFPDDQPGCSKLIDLTNPTASSSSDCDSQDDLPDASVVCSGTTATNVVSVSRNSDFVASCYPTCVSQIL